jgi:flagellar biosynthetic protein FliR
MPVILEPLLNHLPAWLMVFFRITGIFVIAPVFGSKTIPARIRVLLALGLSLCVYPMLLNVGRPSAALIQPVLDHGISLWSMGGAVAMELMLGVVIGYGATLPIMGLQIAGNIADQQMGMGLGSIFNPELSEQGGIVSEFFFIIAMMVFVVIGGHRVLLTTLVGSFNDVPLGGFTVDGRTLDLIVALLASMFDLGMRVAAPLLCLVFLESVAMGFIARTVPQMNIMSVGFPMRIMAGGSLLMVSTATIAHVYGDEVRHALRQLEIYFGM